MLRRRLAPWGNEPGSFWAQVTHQILPATLTCKTHGDWKEEHLVREFFLTTVMTHKSPGSKMREDKLEELLAAIWADWTAQIKVPNQRKRGG